MSNSAHAILLKEDGRSGRPIAMAEAIAEIIEAGNFCTPADLIKKFFRPMEVFKQWNSAY